MKRSSGPRKAADLSKSIHQQLNAYAIAAGAAGVSVLALAQPADAKIVYTPANIRITQNGSVQLDLNHDGIADFSVGSVYQHLTTFYTVAILGVTDKSQNNEVWGTGAGFAAALRKNVRIGATGGFNTSSDYMATVLRRRGQIYGQGPWTGDKQAYLGLKFNIHGKTHYGWARLRVIAQVDPALMYPLITATLTGYAYETIPGKAIVAGQTKGPDGSDVEQPDATLTLRTHEPATLGMLAVGEPGLSIWRREESAVSNR
ncbi:MAG TPA: hypothetical protein VNZ03_35280 [Terriglobales bacterium]|jgi:hypothetical protein|nr:hypothetical protein [Terriglobales bacterium]